MIATAPKPARNANPQPKSTAEVRERAAEIRRSWSREERLCRLLRAQVCQQRLFGALLNDAA
jgi:hypothetical protein